MVSVAQTWWHSTCSAFLAPRFVLTNGMLSYYRANEEEPSASINLLLCTVKVSQEHDLPFCFDVISPEYTLNLQAESKDEMMAWMENIGAGIASNLHKYARAPCIGHSGSQQA